MTYNERIDQIIRWEGEFGETEWLVWIAYWRGRESATKDVSDMYRDVIAGMHKRADACRYHNMAESIIGMPGSWIYTPDYSQDITRDFGNDRMETEVANDIC